MIYLCLDPGLSTIGVAISYEGKLTEPLIAFPAHQLIDHVNLLINKYHPDEIIIGQPHSGPIKDLSVILHDEIGRIFPGKIVLHPEDLTSQQATKKMIEGGVSKNKRQAGNHAAAAALILQDYLDLLQ